MPTITLSLPRTISSHFRSLLWIAILVTFAGLFFQIVEVIKIDFLNVNPHRSQSHAASLPILFSFIFLIPITVGIFITFTVAQIAQSIIFNFSNPRFFLRSYCFIAMTTPLLAILSWYCYDYLTPSDFNLGINTGADWMPYQHGLNFQRFLVMLGLQSCVSIFSLLLLRFENTGHNQAKKRFLLAAIIFACIVGVVIGLFLRQPDTTAKLENQSIKTDSTRYVSYS